MTRQIIFNSIEAERARQGALHPKIPSETVWSDIGLEDRRYLEMQLEIVRRQNNHGENTGEQSWYRLLQEELLEVFVESRTEEEADNELIQLAALAVKMIETRVRKNSL